jgi:hypothetical protein
MKQRNLKKCRYYTSDEIVSKFSKEKRIKIARLIMNEMFKADD